MLKRFLEIVVLYCQQASVVTQNKILFNYWKLKTNDGKIGISIIRSYSLKNAINSRFCLLFLEKKNGIRYFFGFLKKEIIPGIVPLGIGSLTTQIWTLEYE